jgi:hypothetical protein
VAGVSRAAIGPANGRLAEPNELPEAWQAFTEGPLSSPNLGTAAGLTLVTFDAKIPAREGVSCLVLRPGPLTGAR